MKAFLVASLCLSATYALSLPQKPVSSNRSDVDTLEVVQIMWRHGDRTPIVQYPKDPLQDEKLWYPYAEGFSALTLKGRMLHYNFGRFLRERYTGFLSDVYSPKEIFVQSSDADRAIMSALSNMAGMWPPSPNDPKSNWNPALPWQPVPVHTIPKSLDNFINFGADCPRFKELKSYYLRDSPFAKEINEDPENQKLFKYVSENSGLNVTDFELISDLWDTLEIQKNYKFQLPEWTKSVLDTQMKKLAPLFFDQRVLVPDEETKRVKAGPLLKFIVKNMDVARNSPKLDEKEKASHRKAKMYILSGHDTTSSIFLGTLGVFDTQFPAYASAAIVELHKGDKDQPESNQDDHYVRVFFRNETSVPPFELEIPNCDYPCKLDKFKELFGSLLIDGDEWKTACKSGGQDPKKVK